MLLFHFIIKFRYLRCAGEYHHLTIITITAFLTSQSIFSLFLFSFLECQSSLQEQTLQLLFFYKDFLFLNMLLATISLYFLLAKWSVVLFEALKEDQIWQH